MKALPVLSKNFDLLIITHLPAFYKINLYNEIAQNKSIFVLFIGNSSTIRLDDFTDGAINFPYTFLNEGAFETRNIFQSCFRLLKILTAKSFSGLIVNGWELPEFWIGIFFSNARKGLALESTDVESKTKGIKKILKRIFLSRLHFALPSGKPHRRLLEALHFRGDICLSGGVGLSLENKRTKDIDCNTIYKALFIGRLSPEKNLNFLIGVINGMKHIELTIIGPGDSRNQLEKLAGPNVKFYGHINNEAIYDALANHHFLILPSLSETWGLVVEEALQANRPVIVSDAVGCSEDLVKDRLSGLVFRSGSAMDLVDAIKSITVPENYVRYTENIKSIDWKGIRKKQVEAYSSLGKNNMSMKLTSGNGKDY